MNCKIPEKMLAWQLFGAGLDNFGENNKPSLIPVPSINDDELLVKIDAIGLCFSDVKLIRAGEAHPRVISKNLKENPIIPGHEAVMTVVKVGDKLKNKFREGERFIIQADIYVKGKNLAYGYAINGGMAQFSRIDQRILNGDEGCYLLPLAAHIPSALAALIEPWTCVIASYMIEHREAPLKGGDILIACEKENTFTYTLGDLIINNPPGTITLLNPGDQLVEIIRKELPHTNYKICNNIDMLSNYDDIFLCDIEDKSLAEKICDTGKKDAIINFIGKCSPKGTINFDVGNIHYKQWYYQGTRERNLSKAYATNMRHILKPGGACWLPGGAGAMGQMHTQLAVEHPNPPAKILVTDLDDTRIKKVYDSLKDTAEKKGIEFKTLNPSHFDSPVEFETEVSKFAPEGFSDIIMLVPVTTVLANCAQFLQTDGVMNIFAGIPAGKQAELTPDDIIDKRVRFIGSSGSRTHHLKHTLDLVASGKLNPAAALAAIGGMYDLKKGIEAVANAKFPGKTVIFPNCPDMPLTPIENIENLCAELKNTFTKKGYYSLETEKKLLEKWEKC